MIQIANVPQAAGEPNRFIEVRNYNPPTALIRVVNIHNNFQPKPSEFNLGCWKIKYLR